MQGEDGAQAQGMSRNTRTALQQAFPGNQLRGPGSAKSKVTRTSQLILGASSWSCPFLVERG